MFVDKVFFLGFESVFLNKCELYFKKNYWKECEKYIGLVCSRFWLCIFVGSLRNLFEVIDIKFIF